MAPSQRLLPCSVNHWDNVGRFDTQRHAHGDSEWEDFLCLGFWPFPTSILLHPGLNLPVSRSFSTPIPDLPLVFTVYVPHKRQLKRLPYGSKRREHFCTERLRESCVRRDLRSSDVIPRAGYNRQRGDNLCGSCGLDSRISFARAMVASLHCRPSIIGRGCRCQVEVLVSIPCCKIILFTLQGSPVAAVKPSTVMLPLMLPQ
jgi:hypothetical protein